MILPSGANSGSNGCGGAPNRRHRASARRAIVLIAAVGGVREREILMKAALDVYGPLLPITQNRSRVSVKLDIKLSDALSHGCVGLLAGVTHQTRGWFDLGN